ncbi:MAG: hypothetical protein JW751_13290 [Polyangiaceae bacterium]|nr:hypothetical protein [Polyangiaceae bacterium]
MAATDTLVTPGPATAVGADGGAAVVERRSYTCDVCGATFDGAPGGSGLLVWTRGDEVRYEEPPLCDACAVAVSTTAMLGWDLDDGDHE